MDNIYYISIFVILVFVISYNKITKYLEFKKRQSYVDKHNSYIGVLDYYLEKAFDIIYKDRILVYSMSATKPDEDDIKKISIDFAKLTYKLLGANLIKEFIYLYGDEDTFVFTIIEFFNTKSEDDEIKQSSIDQIMEGSDDQII